MSRICINGTWKKEWLPGPQGFQKHKNFCCQTCITIPAKPISISHYSDMTALRGLMLCHSNTPYCTRYQAYGIVFRLFCTIYWIFMFGHIFICNPIGGRWWEICMAYGNIMPQLIIHYHFMWSSDVTTNDTLKNGEGFSSMIAANYASRISPSIQFCRWKTIVL